MNSLAIASSAANPDSIFSISAEKVLPFKYVLGDSIYGVSPEFIKAVEALPGITYFVLVSKNTQCWLKRPMTIAKQYRWGGETRIKTVLADTASKPMSVEELGKNINDYFWYRERCPKAPKG